MPRHATPSHRGWLAGSGSLHPPEVPLNDPLGKAISLRAKLLGGLPEGGVPLESSGLIAAARAFQPRSVDDSTVIDDVVIHLSLGQDLTLVVPGRVAQRHAEKLMDVSHATISDV